MKRILNTIIILSALAFLALGVTTEVPTIGGDTSLPFAITWTEAWADSTPFAGVPTAVSASKMEVALYSRLRMSVVEGDTAGAKKKVPGMSNGDYVVSVMYVPWDTLACAAGGPNRDPMDLTDSSYVYRDSLTWYNADGSRLETDSGTVFIMWNDRTD